MTAYLFVARDLMGELHVDVAFSMARTMWLHRCGNDQEGLQQPIFERLLLVEKGHSIAEVYRSRDALRGLSKEELLARVAQRNPGMEDLSHQWFPTVQTSPTPSLGRIIPHKALVRMASRSLTHR